MGIEIEYKEKDMHPFLVKWGYEQLNVHCKTIDQSKSQNKNKGENEWVHPDLVGVRFEVANESRTSFSKSVECLYHHVHKDVEFYSFELKCQVTLATLKQCYFQAVSNSSWANYGYLVVSELDTFDTILMDELGRLVNAFGIGVILLPIKQFSQARVLFPAHYHEKLDFYTIEKLTHKIQNSDFNDFLNGVNSCVSAKHDLVAKRSILNNTQHFDAILSEDVLKEQFNIETPTVFMFKEEVIEEPKVAKPSIFESIQSKRPDAYTHSQPILFKIKDQVTPFTLWKDFLKDVCLYLKEDNPMLFQQHCYSTNNFSATLFFYDVADKWEAGRIKKRKQIEIEEGLYIISELNAKDIVKTIQALMKTFDVPDAWIKISMVD